MLEGLGGRDTNSIQYYYAHLYITVKHRLSFLKNFGAKPHELSVYTPSHIAIQPDGKIYVASDAVISTQNRVVIAKINRNGSIDNTFATQGSYLGVVGSVKKIAVAADYKVYVSMRNDGALLSGAPVDIHSGLVLRLTSTGAVDTSFGSSGAFYGPEEWKGFNGLAIDGANVFTMTMMKIVKIK